jgi:hypothetical protein
MAKYAGSVIIASRFSMKREPFLEQGAVTVILLKGKKLRKLWKK